MKDGTKICRDCDIEKPLACFPLQPGGRLGRHPLCKECRAAQERRRYARDRQAILARARVDTRRKQRVKWRAVQRKYGLTKESHQALQSEQGHMCAICGCADQPLVVDHDHASGAVRGLLCINCNFALGELLDDRADAKPLRPT